MIPIGGSYNDMYACAFIVELFCGSLPLLSAKQSFENQDFVKPSFQYKSSFSAICRSFEYPDFDNVSAAGLCIIHSAAVLLNHSVLLYR